MHTEIQGSLAQRVTDCQNFMQNPFQAERSKEKERLKARLEAWNKVETSGNDPRHLITEILFKPSIFQLELTLMWSRWPRCWTISLFLTQGEYQTAHVTISLEFNDETWGKVPLPTDL